MEVISHESVDDVEAVPGVDLAQLAVGDRMSVQHFTIEPGATVPDHSHPNEQLGFLVTGEMAFTVDGERIAVEAGDSYVIPSDEPHSAENTGDEPAVGIEVFSPPRENPDWRT